MRDIILLGAGASIEAGIPGSYEMTRAIVDAFATDARQHSHLIRFVVGGLLMQRGVKGEDPFAGVDTEELFNAVDLLADRDRSEATPFISSWHASVEEFDRKDPNVHQYDRLFELIYKNVVESIAQAFPSHAPPFAGDNIDKVLRSTIERMVANRHSHISSFDNVGREVGQYVQKIMDDWLARARNKRVFGALEFGSQLQRVIDDIGRSGGGRAFRRAADLMILMLAGRVWIDSAERIAYLSPILRPLSLQDSLVVATLNYDNSVELLCQANQCACSTGIESWSKTGQFDVLERGLTLLKLHGSIDWESLPGRPTPERPMPHRIIQPVDIQKGRERRDFHPALVFGQRNKLTAEGPFLDLLRAFRRSLEQADRLNVVGYSFRDAHINEYISQWLNNSASRSIRVIDPGFRHSREPYIAALRNLPPSRMLVMEEPATSGLQRMFQAGTEVVSGLQGMHSPTGKYSSDAKENGDPAFLAEQPLPNEWSGSQGPTA